MSLQRLHRVLQNRFLRRHFPVPNPTQPRHDVYEGGAPVRHEIRAVGAAVVPRERVVVIVEALSSQQHGDRRHVPGVYLPAQIVLKI